MAENILGWPQAVVTSILDWSRHVFSPLSLVRESIQSNLYNNVSLLVRTYWLFPTWCSIFTALSSKSTQPLHCSISHSRVSSCSSDRSFCSGCFGLCA